VIRRGLLQVLIRSAVVILLVIAVLFYFVFRQSAPAPLPLPNPNGYDELVKAGGMITGDLNLTNDEALLRATVATNAETLKVGEQALDKPSRVRLDYTITNSAHMEDLASLKRLGQAFLAKGKLAETEGDLPRAAQDYLKSVRLGHRAAQGGIVIHSMMGLEIEGRGLLALEKLSSKLNAEQSGTVSIDLAKVEMIREPLEAVLAQEKAWAQRTFGPKGKLLRLLAFNQLKQGEQRWSAKRKAQETRVQALRVELANRAHEEQRKNRQDVKNFVPKR
jgi:hypothetical protein